MSLLSFFGLSPSPSDDFWYGGVPGTQTAAGVRVDEAAAMNYSACWAASMLLSTAGGMIPLKLYRYLEGGGSEPAKDLDRYYKVHDQINPDMSNMMFRSSRFQFQINWGNAFAELEYDGAGRFKAAHPIHSSRIPKENVRRTEDGKLYYLVNNDDGSKTPLWDWEILHFPSPMSDDGIWGRGVVEQARLSIGFGIAVETQGAAYFGNGARPLLVIEGGKFKNEQDKQEFRRQWNEVHSGPGNASKPALLPPDSKVNVLNFSAEDSQFLETRQHNIEEIARWYSVPPHLIGHLLRSTYNNIEHQSLEFVKYSLMRWLVLQEQELNRKLLSPDERKTLFFRHNVDALERGDLTSRTNAGKEQFFNGKISLNEWRALDDQNPIGPEGDIHFVQQAMIPVDLAAKGPQALKPEAKLSEDMSAKSLELLSAMNDRLAAIETARQHSVADAVLEVVDQVVRVMLEREAKDALEAAKRPKQFLAWMDGFYSDHSIRMEKALAKPIRACVLATGRTDAPEDVLRASVAKHIAAGREALLAAASGPADQFSKAVESCVATWDRKEILSYLGGTNGKAV
jgi:HK97 family phage portal protein